MLVRLSMTVLKVDMEISVVATSFIMLEYGELCPSNHFSSCYRDSTTPYFRPAFPFHPLPEVPPYLLDGETTIT